MEINNEEYICSQCKGMYICLMHSVCTPASRILYILLLYVLLSYIVGSPLCAELVYSSENYTIGQVSLSLLADGVVLLFPIENELIEKLGGIDKLKSPQLIKTSSADSASSKPSAVSAVTVTPCDV
mgnify:FL=1